MTWPTFQRRLQQMVEMVMMVVLVEMVMRIRKEEIRVKEKLYIYIYIDTQKKGKEIKVEKPGKKYFRDQDPSPFAAG